MTPPSGATEQVLANWLSGLVSGHGQGLQPIPLLGSPYSPGGHCLSCLTHEPSQGPEWSWTYPAAHFCKLQTRHVLQCYLEIANKTNNH